MQIVKSCKSFLEFLVRFFNCTRELFLILCRFRYIILYLPCCIGLGRIAKYSARVARKRVYNGRSNREYLRKRRKHGNQYGIHQLSPSVLKILICRLESQPHGLCGVSHLSSVFLRGLLKYRQCTNLGLLICRQLFPTSAVCYPLERISYLNCFYIDEYAQVLNGFRIAKQTRTDTLLNICNSSTGLACDYGGHIQIMVRQFGICLLIRPHAEQISVNRGIRSRRRF